MKCVMWTLVVAVALAAPASFAQQASDIDAVKKRAELNSAKADLEEARKKRDMAVAARWKDRETANQERELFNEKYQESKEKVDALMSERARLFEDVRVAREDLAQVKLQAEKARAEFLSLAAGPERLETLAKFQEQGIPFKLAERVEVQNKVKKEMGLYKDDPVRIAKGLFDAARAEMAFTREIQMEQAELVFGTSVAQGSRLRLGGLYAMEMGNAADGVTGHTLELWKLLERYHLPTLIFVNKMDQAGADLMQVETDLQEHLDEHCISFQGWKERDPDLCEQIAMCSEDVLESYLESGTLTDEEVQNLAAGRALFPVYCGSALKMEGVQELIDGIAYFSCRKEYPDKFGALCYKISRDEKGNRLTWLKLTGGSMKVRGLLAGNLESPATRSEETDEQAPEDNMTFEPAGSGDDAPVPAAPAEKVTQIRLYSGEKFTSADEAFAGQIVAVTGLNESFCTQTYGTCSGTGEILTQPVLSYDLIWPENIDRLQMYGKMKELSEEIPEIEPQLDDRGKAIHIRVMGEVQTEILQSIVQSRYGVAISFGEGRIVYKETIRSCAEGVGHFEPLRHYAEVHLILEPGERGSGIQYDSACSTDILARHWQRLILNMLKAHRQVGILT